MMQAVSPLRYPGGKAKLYFYVKKLLIANNLHGSATYVEPFAGGSGLAIKLLLNNDVKKIVINDLDAAIYYFWKAILEHTDDFINLIDSTDVTVDEWIRQKSIYKKADTSNVLKFAFSVFYLNRTNVSGILKGGVIGGLNQEGTYKIDARFNKERLKLLINEIARNRSKILLFNMDASELLTSPTIVHSKKAFIFFDPPYVKKGAQLYKNFFKENDHISLSESISLCKKKWITTYDMSELIERLYSRYRHSKICLNYSIREKVQAQELIIFSQNLKVPTVFLEKPYPVTKQKGLLL